MIQDNKSATLSCNNDQTVFQPAYGIDRAAYNQGANAQYKPQIDEELTQTVVAKGPNAVAVYGISASDSNAMKSDNPHSGIYEANTSRTLDANGGNPGCNQGGMAVVALERNGARPSHKGCGYSEKDVGFTLNAVERHSVAFGFYTQMKAESQCFTEEKANCIVNGTNPGYQNGTVVNNNQQYIVRRLTPTECARLQGFPDWWAHGLETAEPTDEDIAFWRDVFDTYGRINNKKPLSNNQIKKWLKKPHTDGAEYKMWGNGVALPCVWFVLAGIVWAESEDDAD